MPRTVRRPALAVNEESTWLVEERAFRRELEEAVIENARAGREAYPTLTTRQDRIKILSDEWTAKQILKAREQPEPMAGGSTDPRHRPSEAEMDDLAAKLSAKSSTPSKKERRRREKWEAIVDVELGTSLAPSIVPSAKAARAYDRAVDKIIDAHANVTPLSRQAPIEPRSVRRHRPTAVSTSSYLFDDDDE
jgi:hypothetical protein